MNNVYFLKCYNYYYSDVYNRWYNTTGGLKKITLGKQKKSFDLINFFFGFSSAQIFLRHFVVNSYATTKYETWGHITQVRSNMILVQRFPEKRKFGTSKTK